MVYYWRFDKVVDNMFEEIVLEVTDKKKMKVVDKENKKVTFSSPFSFGVLWAKKKYVLIFCRSGQE